MKLLLPILALMLCLTSRADVSALSKILDEPVIFTYSPDGSKGKAPEVERDRETLAQLTGQKIYEVQRNRGILISPRIYFRLLAQTQGRTSGEATLLAHMNKVNVDKLAALVPALRDAKLNAAANTLQSALASKALDRATQDKFADVVRALPAR